MALSPPPPAEPLRPQTSEASGTDLEASAASAPLARTNDDCDDCDGELDELDAAGTGAPRRVYSACVERRPGRALLNGSFLTALLTELESSITSRDFLKKGNILFVMPFARFDVWILAPGISEIESVLKFARARRSQS